VKIISKVKLISHGISLSISLETEVEGIRGKSSRESPEMKREGIIAVCRKLRKEMLRVGA
jgi:hypothetical protein